MVVVVLGYASIAKFEDHLAEKNTAGIHVRHGDDVFWRVERERDGKGELRDAYRHLRAFREGKRGSRLPWWWIHCYQEILTWGGVHPGWRHSSRGKSRKRRRQEDGGRLKRWG